MSEPEDGIDCRVPFAVEKLGEALVEARDIYEDLRTMCRSLRLQKLAVKYSRHLGRLEELHAMLLPLGGAAGARIAEADPCTR